MRDKIEAAFRPAKDSVSWAHDAVREFDECARPHFTADVREVFIDIDHETGQKVHKVRLTKGLPAEFLRRKATEGLVNARHAFDQATFAARNLISGYDRHSIYFPWASSPTDLEGLLQRRGIDQRLWDAFLARQPYPTGDGHAGGNDAFRALANLANDKHTFGFKVEPIVAFFAHPVQDGITMRYFFPPRWDSVKNEAVIATWKEDAEPQGDYNLKFKILFDDARFPHDMNVAEALSRFAGAAQAFVEQLEARCIDLLT